LVRPQEQAAKASSYRMFSIFGAINLKQEQENDSYAEHLCDILVGLPSISLISEAKPNLSLRSFFETLRLVSPLYLDSKLLV
jgi:hypothetical protein